MKLLSSVSQSLEGSGGERQTRARSALRPLGAVVLSAALLALGMTAVRPQVVAAATLSAGQLGIQKLAYDEKDNGPCTVAVDYTFGNYTSCDYPTQWCAIFAGWIWTHNGVYTKNLSYTPSNWNATYGKITLNPEVGDAVLWTDSAVDTKVTHIEIVYRVDSSTSIETIGGNEITSTSGADGIVNLNTAVTPTKGFHFHKWWLVGFLAPQFYAAVTPTSVKASLTQPSPSVSDVTLSWAVTRSPLSFTIWRTDLTTSGANTKIADVAGTARSYTFSTAANGHSYSYSICAIGGANTECSTSVDLLAVAKVPTNLKASLTQPSPSVSDVTLNWTETISPLSFTIWRTDLTTSGANTKIADVAGTARSYTFSTAANGHSYRYSICAIVGAGTACSTSVDLLAVAVAPTNVTASVTQLNPYVWQVTLNWTETKSPLSFTITRTDLTSPSTLVANVAGTARSYPDSDVYHGASYTYRICANVDAGTACSYVSISA